MVCDLQWQVGEPISKLGPGVAERWLGGCWDWADDEPADWPSNSVDVQVVKEIPVWPSSSSLWEDDWWKLGARLDQDTYQDYDVMSGLVQPKLWKAKYRNLVERAQNASESSGQASRRMTLEFAESMNIHAIVYEERDRRLPS